ncbi:MAG TPA: L-threonylcarbamoyladenylate synthase [Candidatus Nitrosotalea sp.]|nr:L-threonylcarbamoyladenylate synthase [Candidatus Nitrosotalea sp.]
MKVPCNHAGILAAATIIKNGGVVAFPTDTVYGIGCDPYNKKAVKKIYKIKGRKAEKQLPVLGFSIFDISKIAEFDDHSRKLASKYWPGPLTLVLPLKDERIAEALGLEGKIAVRIPDHPCVFALLKECKLLVGTSANRSGQKAASNATELMEGLSGYDLLLDGGEILNPVESTIVEVTKKGLHILRIGKVSEKELLGTV